jgi:hypothetical protein
MEGRGLDLRRSTEDLDLTCFSSMAARNSRRKLIKLSSKNHPEGARRCALRMARLLTMCRYQIVFLAFWMALAPSLLETVSAEECLTTPQQLVEKKMSDRWKELHQKDNQPLFLTISAGQGNNLQFVGRKPDGSTWISGAMSICPSLGNKYQVTLDRIDKAPLFVALKLRGMSDTILAGSSRLKFGTGQHCGNPDPCIEFAPE